MGSLGPRMFWGTRATNFSIYTTKMEGAEPKILGTGAKFKTGTVPKKLSCKPGLRFATARCRYGYEKSNLLPVTSALALQYGFPAAACFSTTAKYVVWRSPHYVGINFHFHAIFMIISLFSEVKFKD